MRRPPTSDVALALLAAAILWAGLAAARSPETARGDAARGRRIYLRNCMVCHFPDGSGGKKVTPNGNPSRDFREPSFWRERTDAQLRTTIREGIPRSGMIPWDGILKPREIEDVLSYLKTFARRPAADSARVEAPPPAAPADSAATAEGGD